jgi:organic radical activating enzyme
MIMQYPINEMFQARRGYFTGVPAIFIRLQGCPVGCAWCDTKHTWDKLADREVSLLAFWRKPKRAINGARQAAKICWRLSGVRAGPPATWSLPAASPAFTI